LIGCGGVEFGCLDMDCWVWGFWGVCVKFGLVRVSHLGEVWNSDIWIWTVGFWGMWCLCEVWVGESFASVVGNTSNTWVLILGVIHEAADWAVCFRWPRQTFGHFELNTLL